MVELEQKKTVLIGNAGRQPEHNNLGIRLKCTVKMGIIRTAGQVKHMRMITEEENNKRGKQTKKNR